MVEEGETVTPDTLLVKVDLEGVKAAGKEDTVIIAFTNMDIVEDYTLSNTGELSQGAVIGKILWVNRRAEDQKVLNTK